MNSNSSGGTDEYYPAYMLADWSLERAGRSSSQKKEGNYNDNDKKTVCEDTGRTAEGVATTNSTGAADANTSSASGLVDGDRLHVNSAGMIIIGDEILNGFTMESNLQITSTSLGNVGVPLKRVVIVSDNEQEIAQEVTCSTCSNLFISTW